jgi:hypothetical protein
MQIYLIVITFYGITCVPLAHDYQKAAEKRGHVPIRQAALIRVNAFKLPVFYHKVYLMFSTFHLNYIF